MNNEIFINTRDADLKKRLLFIILLIVYPACILQSCIVSPIYTITDSNVAYKVLPLVFYFLGIIIDILVIFITLATIIYGLYRLQLKSFRSVIVLALAAPAIKNTLKLLISPLFDGAPTLNNFIVDVYSLSVSSLLEILQLLVVLLIVYRILKKRKDQGELVPFRSLIDLKNPLQLSAFLASLIITLVRLSMWVINDLAYYSVALDMSFFLPYILEVVGGICGYLFIIYIFIAISSKDSANL